MAITSKFKPFADVVIANGQTNSPPILVDQYAGYSSLCIVAPAVLTGTTVKVQTGDAEVASVYTDIQSPPGTDIQVAPDKAIILTALPFPCIRLSSNATELANRTFKVFGIRQVMGSA